MTQLYKTIPQNTRKYVAAVLLYALKEGAPHLVRRAPWWSRWALRYGLALLASAMEYRLRADAADLPPMPIEAVPYDLRDEVRAEVEMVVTDPDFIDTITVQVDPRLRPIATPAVKAAIREVLKR